MISMISISPAGSVTAQDIRQLDEPAELAPTIEEYLDTSFVVHSDMELIPGTTARMMYRPFTGIDAHLINLAGTVIVGDIVIGKLLVAFVSDDECFIDYGEPPDFIVDLFNDRMVAARLWHEAMFSQPLIDKYYGGENPF